MAKKDKDFLEKLLNELDNNKSFSILKDDDYKFIGLFIRYRNNQYKNKFYEKLNEIRREFNNQTNETVKFEQIIKYMQSMIIYENQLRRIFEVSLNNCKCGNDNKINILADILKILNKRPKATEPEIYDWEKDEKMTGLSKRECNADELTNEFKKIISQYSCSKELLTDIFNILLKEMPGTANTSNTPPAASTHTTANHTQQAPTTPAATNPTIANNIQENEPPKTGFSDSVWRGYGNIDNNKHPEPLKNAETENMFSLMKNRERRFPTSEAILAFLKNTKQSAEVYQSEPLSAINSQGNSTFRILKERMSEFVYDMYILIEESKPFPLDNTQINRLFNLVNEHIIDGILKIARDHIDNNDEKELYTKLVSEINDYLSEIGIFTKEPPQKGVNFCNLSDDDKNCYKVETLYTSDDDKNGIIANIKRHVYCFEYLDINHERGYIFSNGIIEILSTKF